MYSVMKAVGDDRGANDQSLLIKEGVMVPGRVPGRICAIGNTDTTSHPPFFAHTCGGGDGGGSGSSAQPDSGTIGLP